MAKYTVGQRVLYRYKGLADCFGTVCEDGPSGSIRWDDGLLTYLSDTELMRWVTLTEAGHATSNA